MILCSSFNLLVFKALFFKLVALNFDSKYTIFFSKIKALHNIFFLNFLFILNFKYKIFLNLSFSIIFNANVSLETLKHSNPLGFECSFVRLAWHGQSHEQMCIALFLSGRSIFPRDGYERRQLVSLAHQASLAIAHESATPLFPIGVAEDRILFASFNRNNFSSIDGVVFDIDP